jgi:hypothetical protein
LLKFCRATALSKVVSQQPAHFFQQLFIVIIAGQQRQFAFIAFQSMLYPFDKVMYRLS